MCKRAFDIVASFLGLALISPVLLFISFLIKVSMPGPVFFLQERTGRYGKPFTIVKFRTMKLNHGGNSISVRGENRITPLGAKLRRYKLDELPELWNVLIGEMSFVGPRPDLREYTDRLEGEDKLILELRPGITGPASLKYSNEEDILATIENPQLYNDEVLWPDKVKINLSYYYSRNFFMDIKIIFQTIFVRNT